MSVYIVSYELRKPDKNYDNLYGYLEQFIYCHDHTSCWFIETTLTAQQIRDGAKQYIDGNDTIFVARLDREWGGFNMKCGDWLNSPPRRW